MRRITCILVRAGVLVAALGLGGCTGTAGKGNISPAPPHDLGLLGRLRAASPTDVIDLFTTDGCSQFPDRKVSEPAVDWQHCCVEHDKAYWAGGPRDVRKDADKALRRCVTKAGSAKIGGLMYIGVRIAGGPGNGTHYRWGYGWPYLILYDPLTEAQRGSVRQRIEEYERLTGRPWRAE